MCFPVNKILQNFPSFENISHVFSSLPCILIHFFSETWDVVYRRVKPLQKKYRKTKEIEKRTRRGKWIGVNTFVSGRGECVSCRRVSWMLKLIRRTLSLVRILGKFEYFEVVLRWRIVEESFEDIFGLRTCTDLGRGTLLLLLVPKYTLQV